MEEGRLTSALDRAERALARIEQAIPQLNRAGDAGGKDEELRARVREAVAELDQIIRMAENA